MPRRSGSVTSSKGNIDDGLSERHDPNVCFGCVSIKYANLKKRHYSESDVFEPPGRKMTNQSDSSQDDAGANYTNEIRLSVPSSASITSGLKVFYDCIYVRSGVHSNSFIFNYDDYL